jgi:hypothetical protein
MTDTEILLACAMIAGFALLALSVAAFAAHRSRAGITLLVLAGVACVTCYPLLASVARAQDDATRAAIEAKYGFHVDQWGGPLGDSTVWVIDGQQRVCDHIDLSDRDDPVLECHAPEPGEVPGH